jgi:hypothetical protein
MDVSYILAQADELYDRGKRLISIAGKLSGKPDHPTILHALRVFGDNGYRWLCRPHPDLGGAMPLEIIVNDDAEQVDKILSDHEEARLRAEHGMVG